MPVPFLVKVIKKSALIISMKEWDISKVKGLSEEEAERRLNEEGYNELPSKKKKSTFDIAFEVLKEPMFLLLVACGVIYLIFGDIQEALMLLLSVFVIIGITFYQEKKTERALEALRDLSSPRAFVIRGGEQKRIAGREVARGDILILSEGDRVPADAVLRSSTNFSCDESLLTGESVSVRKTYSESDFEMGKPGGDDLPFVFSGSLVVNGQGLAEVLATGMKTEIGKIGKALQTVDSEQTQLQRETRNLVKNFSIVGLFLCIAIISIYTLTRGDLLGGFLAGLTFAMSILPEEFPVVLTVFLALGAWRISQNRVLTRQIPAVETLGSATVLCVDKTGTLTLNKMTVTRLFTKDKVYTIDSKKNEKIPDDFHEVIEYSILSSQKEPFDPMERAFKDVGEKYLTESKNIHNNWPLLQQYPLSEKLLAMTHVFKPDKNGDYLVASKGAPEAIADLCHLEKGERQKVLDQVSRIANEGLRVLGVAKSTFSGSNLPEDQHDFDFKFIGLIGLMDPVRDSVPSAVKEAYGAGIRVIMITGDYPNTAQNIARQIGLKNPDERITGEELDKMTDEELKERIKTVNIFSRVVPEQKLRIVNALKSNDEVVAMTGDGVNDAPALKAASIGIAMGGRGTDVARESSDIVLLDDDFLSIVQVVRVGRRIYDNLKKAMAYILAVHVPIAGMSLIPVILKTPLVLLPMHIVFLELVIDPACSLVFEAEKEEADIMERPPRTSEDSLFSRKTATISFFQGFSVLVVVLAVFLMSYYGGDSETHSRALTYTTLIFANLGLIFMNRSWSRTIFRSLELPNRTLWYVAGGALFSLGVILYLPFGRDLFKFSPLSFTDILLCMGAGFLSILWFEVWKIFHQRHLH
ncbi:MAG TPA: cation-translocating P-type ATPase [Candidatus Methanofastidiosum sp.]|nr:cation-translocating P-type ATPase [Methanofastidiosum sp.]